MSVSTPDSDRHVIDARLLKRYGASAGSQSFQLDIRLQVAAGITALLGPSGAGKSLTLNCLAGFANPDAGRILIDDQLCFDAASGLCVPPHKRRCGYIFQDHALFPHMTVRENLTFAASAARVDSSRGLHLRRRVNELLDLFELTELADRKPGEVSGGQKQRAALARILLSEPRLLLLDEPTRGLDARLRASFYAVLEQTRQRLNIPVILVTHDLEECFELADMVCLMDNGRFLQSGPRDQVFSRPASVGIARSLGMYCVLPAMIGALDPGRNTSLLRIVAGESPGEVEGPYLPGRLIGDHGFLCVRASEIKLAPETGLPSRNRLGLALVSSAASASGVRIQLEGDIFVTVSEAEFASLRGTPRLLVAVPPAAVYFIEK